MFGNGKRIMEVSARCEKMSDFSCASPVPHWNGAAPSSEESWLQPFTLPPLPHQDGKHINRLNKL